MLLILVLSVIAVVYASPAKDTFIINGGDATEFVSHHVHILIRSSQTNPTNLYTGSGSLISPRVIVTVAQNVFRFDTFIAGVGNINFSQLHWRAINGRLVHPDYSDTATDRLEYNIALLRLAEEMDVNGVIPLLFFNILTLPLPQTNGSISGFGIKDQSDITTVSDILQIGTTTVTSNALCLSTYNFLTTMDSHFCTISDDYMNFCGGDQGAAFYSSNVLLGIASTVFDANNCGKHIPALYERTSFYHGWLTNNIASDASFQPTIPYSFIVN